MGHHRADAGTCGYAPVLGHYAEPLDPAYRSRARILTVAIAHCQSSVFDVVESNANLSTEATSV